MTKGLQKLMVIGGSAGSLSVVLKIIHRLKSDSKSSFAIVIIFHRSDTDTSLIDLLDNRTRFKVKEAEDKETLEPNVIYVAPADYHLLIEKDKSLSLDASEKINFSRPSIDATFESAADAFGNSLTCMLLSGANEDGVQGLVHAQRLGSCIVIQDPATAEVAYMPQQALKKVQPDFILTPENIDAMIVRFTTEKN
jgi:two-component system, chemotaxis family, protein-glutamate methylesterase/glutaminase